MDNITNYEHIKNMSIYELAYFLYCVNCDFANVMKLKKEWYTDVDIVKWLESKSGVDDG